MIPFVMIKLDKPRKIRFGMGAMVEFEQLTGIKLTELQDEMSISVCAKVLWVMLKQEDKALTFDQTIELIDEYSDNLNDVIEKVTEAIQAAFDTGNKSPNALKPTVKKS